VPLRLRVSKARELRLHVAMQHGKLFIAVRDDALPSDLIEPPGNRSLHLGFHDPLDGSLMTLDITGISPVLAVAYKSLVVSVNGCWQPAASGILAATGGKAAAVEALASGVPCVVHCRDGGSENPTHLAHTLHLDTVRR